MELYIVRHGQSTNNALGDPLGRDYDPALTEIGVEQAERVSHFLAAGGHLARKSVMEEKIDPDRPVIDRLYCSPMIRALRTAKPIGREVSLNPEVWVDLHETGGLFLDHGENGGIEGFPGCSRDEILKEFTNYVLPEDITDGGWWKGAYEGPPASYERALLVADKLWERALSDERIAIVSHGGFGNLLLKALGTRSAGNGFPSDRLYYTQYNTAISWVDFQGDEIINLRYLNLVEHLPKELIT